MYYTKKQTPKKDYSTIITLAFGLMAFAVIMFGISQHNQLNMERYASANNCTWQYNGTFYWDDRDYTCK